MPKDCCSGQQSEREADASCHRRGLQMGLGERSAGPALWGAVSWCVLHDGIRECAEPTGHVGSFGPTS